LHVNVSVICGILDNLFVGSICSEDSEDFLSVIVTIVIATLVNSVSPVCFLSTKRAIISH